MARRINSVGVTEALTEAICLHGDPEHIRCDNGPKMTAKVLRQGAAETGSQNQDIAPESP